MNFTKLKYFLPIQASAAASCIAVLLVFFFSCIHASEVPALIPFPQKVEWKQENFKPGGTIHISHFFGYPSWISEKTGTVYAATELWSPVRQEVSFWISFHDWSRSGGRRGGPFPEQGQWHKTNPKVWVNHNEILPPLWNHPGLPEKTDEIPFTDENYSFRNPVRIGLKKGWNRVLLKIPQDGTSWKWMFTFVPVEITNDGVREVEGLKFQTPVN